MFLVLVATRICQGPGFMPHIFISFLGGSFGSLGGGFLAPGGLVLGTCDAWTSARRGWWRGQALIAASLSVPVHTRPSWTKSLPVHTRPSWTKDEAVKRGGMVVCLALVLVPWRSSRGLGRSRLWRWSSAWRSTKQGATSSVEKACAALTREAYALSLVSGRDGSGDRFSCALGRDRAAGAAGRLKCPSQRTSTPQGKQINLGQMTETTCKGSKPRLQSRRSGC